MMERPKMKEEEGYKRPKKLAISLPISLPNAPNIFPNHPSKNGN
jgi:hypothetical protein